MLIGFMRSRTPPECGVFFQLPTSARTARNIQCPIGMTIMNIRTAKSSSMGSGRRRIEPLLRPSLRCRKVPSGHAKGDSVPAEVPAENLCQDRREFGPLLLSPVRSQAQNPAELREFQKTLQVFEIG